MLEMIFDGIWMKTKALWVVAVLICYFTTSSTPCSSQDIEQYLHPNSRITAALPSSIFEDDENKPITYLDAAAYAFELLTNRGVVNPIICEATWIAAPLTGYLVDALGSWDSDGKSYSILRVGVHDGLGAEYSDRNSAGNEFIFLALGRDSAGNSIWYPPPGPDHQLREDETYDMMLPYEFLLNRERLESLQQRYPLGR